MHAVGGVDLAVGRLLDPTVQPVHQTFYVWAIVALATVLLVLSMIRHMRRAHANLSPDDDAAIPPGAVPAEAVPEVSTTPPAGPEAGSPGPTGDDLP